MMEKRPLVWLSAEKNTRIRKDLEKNWNLIDFNLDSPVPMRAGLPDEARVGVLELSDHSGGDVPWPESWLESLGLTYWVAISPVRPVSGTRAAKLIVRYCSDFHTSPVNYERINTVLGHLWGMTTILELHHNLARDDYQGLALMGNSQPVKHARHLLRRFSATLEPVLITGESGTGKEAAAWFIHTNSTRANGPLVFVNCAALPTNLTQSELFGYEKGAFTSAMSSHQGRLEQANGGSLVLSGIDELQLEQQSVLLRFLQEGQIERVGGNAQIRVNCRIIATTSQPLPELVSLGRFRSDVYFRLGSLEVKLPLLKDRLEDIPALAQEMLEGSLPGSDRKRLSKGAVRSLVNHTWPGNFRELQNHLRKALLLCDQPVIEASDLGLPDAEKDADVNFSLKEFRDRADRQALICSLRLANYNVSEAAKLLKISRVSLYRLLDKYNPGPHNRQTPYRKGDLP